MIKQRSVVHLVTGHAVKSAWKEVDGVTAETAQRMAEILNEGVQGINLELPNGDFSAFNSRHVVSVVVETWREKNHDADEPVPAYLSAAPAAWQDAAIDDNPSYGDEAEAGDFS